MTEQPTKKSGSGKGNRKRAFCENEKKFIGDWQDNENIVYDEIDAHRAKQGNGNHIVNVIVEGS